MPGVYVLHWNKGQFKMIARHEIGQSNIGGNMTNEKTCLQSVFLRMAIEATVVVKLP